MYSQSVASLELYTLSYAVSYSREEDGARACLSATCVSLYDELSS